MHQFCANIRYNSVFINTRISVSSLKCFTIPASSSLYLHDCTGNQFRKQNKSTSINKNSLAEFDIFPVFVWWGAKQNKHQRSDQRVCLPACRDEYSLLRWNASDRCWSATIIFVTWFNVMALSWNQFCVVYYWIPQTRATAADTTCLSSKQSDIVVADVLDVAAWRLLRVQGRHPRDKFRFFFWLFLFCFTS